MNVAIAFETQGGWRKEKDAIAATVLQVKIHSSFFTCSLSSSLMLVHKLQRGL